MSLTLEDIEREADIKPDMKADTLDFYEHLSNYIKELEAELSWAAEKVKRLVVERDEARRLCEKLRDEKPYRSAHAGHDRLPWEKEDD